MNGIEVKYIGYEKGKGVFATRDFKYGDVIFKEKPLCSQQKVMCFSLDKNNIVKKKITTCDYCLKSNIPFTSLEEQLKTAMDEEEYLKFMPNIEYKSCDSCYEVNYCSAECKEKAWRKYHQLLCTHNKDVKKSEDEHPFILLERMACLQKRTNPLLIAKMFAEIINVGIAAREKQKQLNPFQLMKHSAHQYARFVSNEEEHERDTLAVQLIKETIQSNFERYHSDSYQQERSFWDEFMDLVINIQLYRLYNGLILRNASTIHPISPLHQMIDNHEHIVQQLFKVIQLESNNKQSLIEHMNDNYTITATGLFTIHNSMNHCCVPNATSLTNDLDDIITVVCTKPSIKQGDEISISYIDEVTTIENLEKRRQMLYERYVFVCQCSLCSMQEQIPQSPKQYVKSLFQ